jgi:hypothetical protein
MVIPREVACHQKCPAIVGAALPDSGGLLEPGPELGQPLLDDALEVHGVEVVETRGRRLVALEDCGERAVQGDPIEVVLDQPECLRSGRDDG